MDAPSLRRDVSKLHSMVHQFATKSDIEKLVQDVARIRSLISDFKDDFSSLKDRVAKLEDLVEANMKWTREQIEALQKLCENLEGKVIANNKIIARLSDKLESSGN